eukprot:5968916-Pyramimonas_sp.AAC.1
MQVWSAGTRWGDILIERRQSQATPLERHRSISFSAGKGATKKGTVETFIGGGPLQRTSAAPPSPGTRRSSEQDRGLCDSLRGGHAIESDAGRDPHRRQQLRLRQRLRELEAQPPAGLSLRRVEGGGSALRNRGV